MQSQQEQQLFAKGKALMMLHACKEIREDGLSNLSLQPFAGHSALPQHSAWTNRTLHLSNIEYGHLTTPRHYAFGRSSQSHDLILTNAIASLTSNLMLSGYHNNCLETAPSSSTTLSSAEAYRQQALSHYASEMNQNSDYCMQMPQLKDLAQTRSTSDGLAEPPACHELQSVHPRKKLTIEETSTSCSMVQSPANSSVWKSKGDAFSITSSTSKKLSSKNGKPKRALTAYNIFFKEAREQLLAERQAYDQSHVTIGNGVRICKVERRAKVSFEEMGKVIGLKWKKLDKASRRMYDERAKADKRRYCDELFNYRMNERKKIEVKFAALQASVSEETKQQYFTRMK